MLSGKTVLLGVFCSFLFFNEFLLDFVFVCGLFLIFGHFNAKDELAEYNLFYFSGGNRFFNKSFDIVLSCALFALFCDSQFCLFS